MPPEIMDRSILFGTYPPGRVEFPGGGEGFFGKVTTPGEILWFFYVGKNWTAHYSLVSTGGILCLLIFGGFLGVSKGPPLRAFVNIPCKHILPSEFLEHAFRQKNTSFCEENKHDKNELWTSYKSFWDHFRLNFLKKYWVKVSFLDTQTK